MLCGDRPVSIVCDNCPMNQALYEEFGGPGPIDLLPGTSDVFLVYDYVNTFQNRRNNWITEEHQELQYRDSGTDCIARWLTSKMIAVQIVLQDG